MNQLNTEREQRFIDLAAGLADDFAPRAAQHDEDASFPDENYARLKETGYTVLIIPEKLGGLGATLRHAVNVLCARFIGTAFPYSTFIINISGSIVMGLIAGYLAFRGEASQAWRLFLMTGILGGYTTFSAFSLDTAILYERGEIGLAALYVLGSVVLSILGLFAGLALVRYLA